MLNELEDELELQEEAMELAPLVAHRAAPARRVIGQQPKQALACPRPSWQTVSRFPRHKSAVSFLPGAEQAKIRTSAGLIRRSFQPGCRPVLTIGLVGHADKDPQGPSLEKRMSEERAAAVRQALQGFINDPRIVSRITWQVTGVGASSLIVSNARTEPERARNRRVEIFLGSIPLDGLIKAVNIHSGGASIRFVGRAAPRAEEGEFNFDLYRDPNPPAPLLPRTEWMRRGAILGLAQRAFTNDQRTKLIVENDLVQSIEVYKA
jgi:hypothetical protein